MRELVLWLNALPLGQTMRRVSWAIPLTQTVHILATGMILSSVIMIDLRVWGRARSQTFGESARRFVPWIWSAVVLVVATGVLLIMAASRRALLDPSFEVKLWLMAAALAATLVLQLALRYRQKRWDIAGAGWAAGFVAAAILMLWVAVTVASRGRWIGSAISHWL
jgi:uncharacterized membrane protein